MTPNFIILFAAAVIPLALSTVWYSPLLFGGDDWNRMAHIPEEKKASLPIWKTMISLVFNFLIACGIYGLCVHQAGVYSLVGGNAELLKTGIGAAFMNIYGEDFLTFKHGVFHAILASIMFVFPMLMYITIFERKGARYFWVNFTFWVLSMGLMGGIIGMCGAMPV